jgi:hypothetical protein
LIGGSGKLVHFMMCFLSRFFAGKNAAEVKFQVLPKDEKRPAYFL